MGVPAGSGGATLESRTGRHHRARTHAATLVVLAAAALVAATVLGGMGGWAAIVRAVEPAAPPPDTASSAAHRFAAAAERQVGVTVSYDAAYVELEYPGGDVPMSTGVCTDVVIRAMREMGVDLQVEVHEDMASAFDEYPDKWGLKTPNASIDHRRVLNLQVFFARRGTSLPVTDVAADYQPGDIVTWKTSGGLPHIGVVSTERVRRQGRFAIVHNYGRGTRIDDALFTFPITGHYRWF